MSRILIVGSNRFSENPTEEGLARFRELSRQLGQALVERGHEIVVCSRSEHTTDWCVVHGANEAGSAANKVTVSFFVSRQEFEDAAGSDPYGASTFPNVTRRLKLTNSGWFSTYDTAAANCDAAIALGGSARGTGGALYIALARRKPVVGIPACGGAAKDIWRDTEPHYEKLPAEVRLALVSSDPAAVARAAVEAAEYLIKNDPFPPRSPAPVYALYPVVMLVCGASWVYFSLVWGGPSWKPYPMAAIMAVAGMLLRYVGDAARNQEAYFGSAKVFKDAARVFGLLLLASLLVDWVFSQAASGDIKGELLRTKFLAIVGFAAGYLVEEVSGILTDRLTAVVRSVMERAK